MKADNTKEAMTAPTKTKGAMEAKARSPRIFQHPGFGKKRANSKPKGRMLDEAALEQVRELIGDDGKTFDMTIEYLHRIQDKYGCITSVHMHALANLLRVSQAQINETASFYAHFDIVKEGQTKPASLTVRVCDSLTCQIMGAQNLKRAIKQGVDETAVRVVSAPCMGRCDKAPVVEVGHNHLVATTAENVFENIRKKAISPRVGPYQSFEEYEKDGYKILKSALNGELSAQTIIDSMSDSGLRGLGGAGFPVGRKWSFVRAEKGSRLMAVNIDEGEPGTIKDHYYLSRHPHQFLEGMLIAAFVVEATDIYIYLRDEYPDIRKILLKEIHKVQDVGLSPHTRMHLRRGAGAYICGEESAMLESIEGKRGWPRQRPPFVAQKGLWGRATLVNNAESLYWVPKILQQNKGWFSSHGANGRKGLRSFSVSGRVNLPGVHLAPAGITIRQLIDTYAGGMQKGHIFKAYLPGGASGGILPATMDEIPLDFDTLNKYGCFIGSAAVVVLSHIDSIVDVVKNLMAFFKDESCGQCTPCRVGTDKIMDLINKKEWDLKTLEEISTVMQDASICGLGQAAPNPLLCAIKYFKQDLVTKKFCSSKVN